MTVYLDCNATTPMEPAVIKAIQRFMEADFGNAGSRTHNFGAKAKQAVERAREQVASLVSANAREVIFTSGATESNNLAILGLAEHGKETGKKHIVSSQIEHNAVLEPLGALEKKGFTVTLVPPLPQGWVDPTAIEKALRPETLLVSVMHVNNETGIIQPIEKIANILKGHEAFFHIDAAQGFGKINEPLTDKRIDLISISGHKIYGPKGVGALVARHRGFQRPPLHPLVFGGGQERGLRPGTLAVPLIAGLGTASELAATDGGARRDCCENFRQVLVEHLENLGGVINGDRDHLLFNTVNLRFPGLDSEALMLALKGIVAISNGSACTSSSYEPSHVLLAMGQTEKEAQEALRFSWCHMTEEPDWDQIRQAIHGLQ